ncbi:MAG: hypothetical protein CSH49_12810 [Alcanivorax sp.]|nr:MAG: hypothetical protein D9N13_19420 [Ketobacter sp. GenoA1]RLT95271.1 MAG: hypothetical protein D9N15_15835 [Ketobacter sp.]TNC88164.1 MAG: hypothetical protein CSH49_12810 [Alcanivorax sp.]
MAEGCTSSNNNLTYAGPVPKQQPYDLYRFIENHKATADGLCKNVRQVMTFFDSKIRTAKDAGRKTLRH